VPILKTRPISNSAAAVLDAVLGVVQAEDQVVAPVVEEVARLHWLLQSSAAW